jgi:hypothetical protein
VPEDRPIRPANQPFTFGGVARFAHAPVGRLFLAALVLGLLSGMAVTWLGARGWAPAIDEAVAGLPENAAIQNGFLRWPERFGRLLGATEFFSIEVVLENAPRDSSTADLSLELHQTYCLTRSLLGATTIPYPRNFNFPLDRPTVVPAWGAWRMPLLFSLIPGTALALIISWSLLAIPYAVLARIIGALFRRDLNFRSAWKLSVAAQLPGSILMTFAIALYAGGQVTILFIVVMLVAHFIPTALYLLISPVLVPKPPKLPKPARSPADEDEENPFNAAERRTLRGKNPFKESD